MNKKLFALPLAAVVSVLAFTACSAPAPSASPTPSVTPPAAVQTEVPTADVACVDGVAEVTVDSTDVTIDGDCATVLVNASNSQVTVGDVKKLEINGSINRVVVDEVAQVIFTADGNVVVTESDPQVVDKGAQNVVTADKE